MAKTVYSGISRQSLGILARNDLREVRAPIRTQMCTYDLVQIAKSHNKGGQRVASRTHQPEAESIGLNVRYAESRQPVHSPTVDYKRKTAKAEDTIAPTGRIPATLSRGGDDRLRFWNDEVVTWPVARKEAPANFLDSFLVQGAFLWRERLENHFVLVITVHADPSVIDRPHNVGTSHRMQLRDQNPDGLQRLFAETTLRRELVGSDDALVDLIEQENTQGLEVIQGFIDDR